MRIAGGDYRPGALLPTERQLALELRMSRPVVRLALAELASGGWIVREPGHRPRVAHLPPGTGRSDRDSLDLPMAGAPSRKARAIAAVMPMNPLYPAAYNILSGVQRTLARRGSPLRIVLFDTRSLNAGAEPLHPALPDAERERNALESAAADDISALILWHIGGETTLPAIRDLQARGVRIIFVDRIPAGIRGDFVGVDNRSGAREAVRFLAEAGHRRILHLTVEAGTPESDSISVRERGEGYREALTESGLWVSEDLVMRSIPEVIARVRHGIASADPDRPTAVFAVNDAWAHRLVRAATESGISVPDDLSVIGFDDLDRYSQQNPVLTTMFLPFEAMGERAAELLLRRLESDREASEPERHVLLTTSLVVRGTTTANRSGISVPSGFGAMKEHGG